MFLTNSYNKLIGEDMAIICQSKRLLITDFDSDDALSNFIKSNTITDLDMFFNISKEWISLFETTYDGEPALAIPRRYPMNYLKRYTNVGDIVKEPGYSKASTRKIKCTFNPKDAEQAEMLDFLQGINKYADIAKSPRRGLFARTGTGKTYLSIKYISNNSTFAFINCPDEKAILTWKQEILKFSDIKESEIGVMKGRESLSKLVKNKDNYKIILGSSKTFSSLINSNEHGLITEFFEDMEFGLTIHDEAHLNIIVLFFLEMCTNTRRTFYLTATLGRRIYKEGKLLEMLMPADNCLYFQEILEKYTVRVCKYHTNPIKPEHVKGLNRPRGFDYLGYGKKYLLNKDLPYMNKYLDEVMRRVVMAARKALTDPSHKVAIVCKTKLENEILSHFIAKTFPKLTLGIFNSEIENINERFEQTNAQIILTTDKSFAGIINVSKLEAIIFLHPTTSEEHLLQIVGRMRDDVVKKKYLVYILIDASFRKCLASMSKALGVLEPHSIDVKTIVLNEKISVKVDIDEL